MRRPSLRLRPAAALLALAASAAVARTASAQAPAPPATEYSYRFRVTGEDDRMVGLVRVRGDVARLDTESDEGGPSDQYMLVSDGGRRLTIVHPRRREYDETTSDEFAQIIGRALRAVSPVVQIKLRDARVSTQPLGAGETIAGYTTQRYRITQRFEVSVGALGMGAEDAEYHVVTTDYWVHPGLALARNPLVELMANADAALAQRDEGFARRSAAERAALPGTPLRIVVTAREASAEGKGKRAKERRVDIFDIRRGPQPASAFQVPRGYERKNGLRWDRLR